MPRITEVCHDTRLEILNLVRFSPKGLLDLSKDIGLSKPEISRHLSRLQEQGLVHKKDHSYTVSDLGDLILKILSPLDVIFNHYDFFQNHSLADLPLHIIKDLDLLKNSELVDGTGFILTKIEEISQLPTNEIKLIMNGPFPDFREQIVSTAHFILPSRVEPFFREQYGKILNKKYKSYKVNTLPVINYPLGIIDNKYGFLFFSDLNGKVDLNSAFYTEDPTCIKFLVKIWDHFWKSSSTFLSKK